MIDGGVQLNWDNFKRLFLEKYFLDDVRSQKEVEFLELKQGNDTVAEYAAKFDALVRYCTHYHGEGGERAKCIKFVNGLSPEIKTTINYQEIYHYPTLVNKSRIYDRDNRARAIFYKGAGGPMRAASSSAPGKSKPYSAPAKIQGNYANSRSVARNSFVSGATSVGGSVSTPISQCKKCGLRGHENYNCPDKEITCFNCRSGDACQTMRLIRSYSSVILLHLVVILAFKGQLARFLTVVSTGPPSSRMREKFVALVRSAKELEDPFLGDSRCLSNPCCSMRSLMFGV
ncbi:uncharacterized protein LOC109793795 [Cajanus cajan]|uniref:uncharacterized protein LOC109793795 n=1 Tax=Cajanus cajan TaxID=3821 RepID=UPI00098DA274|nr:uncharacterized protein LOC109793795 [Cajanus cajan]